MNQDKQRKRVAFYTLGCKVNQYDTEAVSELFSQRGFEIVDFSELADVYIINTCTVTNMGDRKSRQIVRRASRQNPDAVIVVMGCYAQVSPEEVAEIEGVDLVIGTSERRRIVDLVEEFISTRQRLSFVKDVFTSTEFEDLPVTQFSGRTRATIKIQEGCNEFCTYCKIPYARGRSRSRSPESVIAEARRLEEAGFQEMVLTGIHLGAYGRDLEPKIELADLLECLCRETSIPRLRISSIDPHEITERFIEILVDNPNICRHLHVPLQGGHDEILKSMRRRYTLREYRAVIERVRAVLPEIAITTDIIVGFPGETEEQFVHSLEFVEEMEFSRLHVFRYSKRAGTPAAKLPNQVPAAVKQERSRRMMELGARLSLEFHRRFLGRTMQVLLEQTVDPEVVKGADLRTGLDQTGPKTLWEGLTDNYIRVVTAGDGDLSGRLILLSLTGASSELMIGQMPAENLRA